MFPTTVWTRIGEAGAHDGAALAEFAERYRPAVLEFIERRGFRGSQAEDLCQDVFVRVLRGGVLAKADRARGRFRTLLLTVTVRVLQDSLRKRREVPVEDLDATSPERDPDFDHAWALLLAERALDEMREQGSPYFAVLSDHLAGVSQDRNKLWHARRKLGALIRREVALTCSTREDLDAELAYLARYLRPPEHASEKD